MAWEATRGDEGWVINPKTTQVLAYKDVTEGKLRPSPQQLTRLKGSQIDTITVSPDGAQLMYTVLISGSEKNDFRSQVFMVKTDGAGGSTWVTEGKSLDLTPSFTPDGQSIVFSSNRAGRRLSVWQMSTVGNPGKTQLTTGDNNDLWPTIDADPKPRLFYQTLVGPDPRLFSCPVGTTLRTDLTEGTQPRVSPRADSVLFVTSNQRTGKRDICIMTDKGDKIQNITNTPDIDECDPSWNKDGSMIAFSSDAGSDADKNRNYDIWVQELTKTDATQITTNGSHDDNPAWDNGNNVYFRSNRGGDWNVWKIAVK
jgi:Tol biopolymer transport system component